MPTPPCKVPVTSQSLNPWVLSGEIYEFIGLAYSTWLRLLTGMWGTPKRPHQTIFASTDGGFSLPVQIESLQLTSQQVYPSSSGTQKPLVIRKEWHPNDNEEQLDAQVSVQ